MRPIRILIVEDDEDDFLITTHILKSIPEKKFEIEWANTFDKGQKVLLDNRHDICIVDYLLGAKNGIAFIQEALEAHCEIPLILLTGMNDSAVDQAAAELGAFDYLLKNGLNADQLERSIRYSLVQAAMVKEIRENEARYRTIFENSRDMIFIANRNGDFKSVSNAAKLLTGYSDAQLLHMNINQLYSNPLDGERIEQMLSRSGEASRQKIGILCQGGQTRICSLYITVQTDRNGSSYCQGVLHDLTAEIREERVALLNEKMESTGRLMRMLAHEVRNPLTNIGLALDVLESDLPADSELQEYVKIIQRNSERINHLITELLNSSRTTELNKSPVSLSEIVQETLEMCVDRINLKKVSVRTELPDSQDTVLADRDQIKIALTNILVNAIEAMDEGKGLLELTLQKKMQLLVLSIRDNGMGIQPDDMEKLFEPYFTSKKSGMGLGLASTLKIVQQHGAILDVESKVGAGTTFHITFQNVPEN